MDNTFFVGITSVVNGIVGFAFVSSVVIAGLVLGANVGFSLYKRFTHVPSNDDIAREHGYENYREMKRNKLPESTERNTLR